EAKFVNKDSLTANGLTIKPGEDITVTVTVTGDRKDLGNISSKDVKATVDLYDRGAGINTIPVSVSVPSEFEVKKVNPSTIDVTILMQSN
ncbi:MAG: CdaR family protein, partial [Anaerovoracaceae bacterium]